MPPTNMSINIPKRYSLSYHQNELKHYCFCCKNLEKVRDDDYDDAVIVVPFDGHQVVDVHQAPPLLAYTQNSTDTHYRHTTLTTPEAHYYFFPQLEKSTLHCNTGWTASGAGGRRSDVW